MSGAYNMIGGDPMLAPLANNGGPTLTHAWLAGSPVIDAGDPNFDATNTPSDQRGPGFPRVVGRLDIGAYESEAPTIGSVVVNTLADSDDGVCGIGNCTLREAVKYASAGATITFSVSGTITLTQGEIPIGKNLTIQGPASTPGITVSGNNASHIFAISSSLSTVFLSNLTLSGGNASTTAAGNGGAIRNSGTLTVTNCTLTGNSAVNGGAIRNAGNLTVRNSTISGNSATSGGGAIVNSAGVLTVNVSTFANNSASTTGGGIDIVSGSASLSTASLPATPRQQDRTSPASSARAITTWCKTSAARRSQARTTSPDKTPGSTL
jgi:CSLREA domain-containing protein